MPKGIIFDLDNTLYNYDKLNEEATDRQREYAVCKIGITGEEFDRIYDLARTNVKNRLGDTVAACHNRMLYCQNMLELLHLNPVTHAMGLYESYWGYFIENMKPEEGLMEVMRYLKSHDIPVLICTDMTTHIQHRKIKALGLEEYVSYMVSSEEAGKEKPAPEIFELSLEKLRLSPKEVWYVGDSYKKDIEGVRKLEVNAIWYHPGKKDKEGIENFSELLSMLKEDEE